MKTLTRSALVAGVLGFALSAQAVGVESPWFTLDFEAQDYSLAGDGQWTQVSGDLSALSNKVDLVAPYSTAVPSAVSGKVLHLNTEGKTLAFAPSTAADADVCNILEMDVYLVAADEVPDVDANAQTAVYLDGELGLRGYVGTGWVDLTDAAVSAGWYHLAIRMDYENGKIFFQTNGVTVGDANGYAMADNGKTKIEGLGFSGSGYVDNFVGKNFAEVSFDIGGEDLTPAEKAEAEATLDPEHPITQDTVNHTYTVTFKATKPDTVDPGQPEEAIKFVKVYTSATSFKVQRVVTSADCAVTVPDGATRVEACYGEDAEVITDENKEEYIPEPEAEVAVETEGVHAGETAVTISVPNAKSGVYYGLFVDDGEGEVMQGDAILVGMGDDGTTQEFPKIYASKEAWSVKKIRVRAMDTPTVGD